MKRGKINHIFLYIAISLVVVVLALGIISITKNSSDKNFQGSLASEFSKATEQVASAIENKIYVEGAKGLGEQCGDGIGYCKNCLRCEYSGIEIGIGKPDFGYSIYKTKVGTCYFTTNGAPCVLPNGSLGICNIKNKNNVQCLGSCKQDSDCPTEFTGTFCGKTKNSRGQEVDSVNMEKHFFKCINNKCQEYKTPVIDFLSGNPIITYCNTAQKCVIFPNYSDNGPAKPIARCVNK